MKIKKHSLQKLIYLPLLVLAIALSNIGCYMHSDEREALAKDIQSRYASVLPGGLEVLESIDKDTEKLVASRRADFELFKETSGTAIVNDSWSTLIDEAKSLSSTLAAKSSEIGRKKGEETAAATALKKRIDDLDVKLQEMGKAIGKIEDQRTLQERLDSAESIIKEVTRTFETLVPPPGNGESSPVDKRLSQALSDINTYLGSLGSKRDKTEATYSLVLEALRLGRDVAAHEQEGLQQEYNFHERLLAFYQAEERLVSQRGWIRTIIPVFGRYPPDVTVKTTIATLAQDAESGELPQATRMRSATLASTKRYRDERKSESTEALRDVLEQLGLLQTLEITTQGRIDELDFRTSVEKYRNARLLDAVYERQRMSLISYGLTGVVRYSQGGLRSQDIARLINIAQTLAQIVIAVRVGR